MRAFGADQQRAVLIGIRGGAFWAWGEFVCHGVFSLLDGFAPVFGGDTAQHVFTLPFRAGFVEGCFFSGGAGEIVEVDEGAAHFLRGGHRHGAAFIGYDVGEAAKDVIPFCAVFGLAGLQVAGVIGRVRFLERICGGGGEEHNKSCKS